MSKRHFIERFYFQFSNLIFSCLSCETQLMRSFGKTHVKTIFDGKKRSFNFHFLYFKLFLFNTIKKIISLVLYENKLPKEHTFPGFLFHLFMSFLCKPIDAISRNNSFRNDLSLKQNICLIFTFVFHYFSCVLHLKRSLV